MAFPSINSHLIWNKLYTVLIPDQLTLSKEYLSKFGTHVTGNKEVDNMLSTNLTTVMIPVAKILEYFDNGVEIHIPSREDMIRIHKDIELYLGEWRDHIKFDINLSLSEHKTLILSLEKLSKHVYDKARYFEIVDNLFINKKIGLLVNPLQRIKEESKSKNGVKPDYEGIRELISQKTRSRGRFS